MKDAPHYFLILPGGDPTISRWSFIVQAADGSDSYEISDTEPDRWSSERLELLSVVRGLESLDQPSRVTIFTASTYLHRGLDQGLEQWRRCGWTWERHGEMVPVKNGDLWRRLDRASTIHDLQWRRIRFDQPHTEPQQPADDRQHSRQSHEEVAAQDGTGRIPPTGSVRRGLKRWIDMKFKRDKALEEVN